MGFDRNRTKPKKESGLKSPLLTAFPYKNHNTLTFLKIMAHIDKIGAK